MATSVGDEINRATRSHHTTLNQLILQLLPLCLPPHTSNRHVYGLGISHFLPIYATFEASFRYHIRRGDRPSHVEALLRKLHIPPLERAAALAEDVSLIVPPSRRVPVADDTPSLQALLKHMETSFAEKPHLLVAYTWIFYMALFSGGRYIRSKVHAGFANLPDTSSSNVRRGERAGLSFFNFPGDLDGEDLKLVYKSRVAALSAALQPEQRADIVNEGVHIMAALLDLVEEMAEMLPDRALAFEVDYPSSAQDEKCDRLEPEALSQHVSYIRPPWWSFSKWVPPLGVTDLFYASIALVASKAPLTAESLPATKIHVQAE